mmetsp:Transcript_24726/g.52431  ORF Transcript_24726/g.52431 Transcript_24726/m.52431 type:complete len:542 (+) Transcript_24726:145-1770(+)
MRIQPCHLILFILCRRLKVSVWQNHGTELQLPIIERSIQGQEVQHMIAKSTNASLLNGNYDSVILCQIPNQINIKRLHESRVSHSHRKIGIRFLHLISGLEGLGETSSKGEDSDAIFLLLSARSSSRELRVGTAIGRWLFGHGTHSSWQPDKTSLSNFHRNTLGRNFPILQIIPKQILQLLRTISNSPWIPQHSRSIIKLSTGHDHIPQFNLITGAHNSQVGDASQVCQIITSVMCWSVISNNTSTIQNHSNRQILNGYIMHHLIVSTLHERGVDATEGLESLACHTGCEGDGVLFGNTNIEGALGEATSKDVHASSSRHGSGDANNFAMFSGSVDHGVSKDAGEGRSGGLALHLNAGADVELGNTVHAIGRGHGGGISVSLCSLDMQEDRLGRVGITKLFKDGDHVLQIVSIDGTDVEESQFLEDGAASDKTTSIFIKALVHVLDVFGEETIETLGKVTEVLEGLGHQEVGRVGAQLRRGFNTSSSLCSGGEGHLTVIVENDNHATGKIPSVIHGLVSHTTSDGTIADDSNTVILTLVQH